MIKTNNTRYRKQKKNYDKEDIVLKLISQVIGQIFQFDMFLIFLKCICLVLIRYHSFKVSFLVYETNPRFILS